MEKDWVCVYTTDQAYQAEIAREVLENSGINSVVINESDSNFPTIGNIEIMVHIDFQEKATELLKELSN